MRLKIRGGTVQHGESSLCVTCRHATIVKGQSLREEIVRCDRLSTGHDLVRFPVTFCSGYSDRRQPSLREMEDLAWILRTDAMLPLQPTRPGDEVPWSAPNGPAPSLGCGTLASAGRSPLPAGTLTTPS